MPVWKREGEATPYDASAVKIPKRLEKLKTTYPVVALRPERGYSATKYDANMANPPKTLRRQFGQKYDVKKVRNTCTARHSASLFRKSDQDNLLLLARQPRAEAIAQAPPLAKAA
jgi:hypothetical protein